MSFDSNIQFTKIGCFEIDVYNMFNDRDISSLSI